MLSYQIFIRGVLVGLADLVPGVSGSTMALLTGIYPRLLKALAQLYPALILAIRLRIIESLKSIDFAFLIPLVLGMMVSIFGMSWIIAWLLDNARDWLMMFFLGMVIVTAVVLIKEAGSYSWRIILFCIIGYALSLLLQNLPQFTNDPNLPIFFLSGVIAICTMLLPGISGSLVLLLIGMYQPVITSINDLQLVRLICFAMGAISGLLLFSRVLLFVYHRHHRITMALLAGLALGSVQALWPQQQIEYNSMMKQSIIYYGFLIALLPCGLLSGWYLYHVAQKSHD